MRRFLLPLFILLLFLFSGCSGHSSEHTRPYLVDSCPSTPCGDAIRYHDMIINYSIAREPSGEHILSGTLEPLNAPVGAQVDFAVLSFDLVRDLTVSDSYSFPLLARDASQPLPFQYHFTPSGGFDGITFNADIRYVEEN